MRKVNIFVIVVFLFNIVAGANVAVIAQRKSHNVQMQRYLEAWYRGTNETYFNNELPKNTDIVIKDIDDADQAVLGETAKVGPHAYIITIDPRYNVAGITAALTVSHEECHIWLTEKSGDPDSNHGERFQSCELMLAKAGAFKDLW